jgi:hypothetical protein
VCLAHPASSAYTDRDWASGPMRVAVNPPFGELVQPLMNHFYQLFMLWKSFRLIPTSSAGHGSLPSATCRGYFYGNWNTVGLAKYAGMRSCSYCFWKHLFYYDRRGFCSTGPPLKRGT